MRVLSLVGQFSLLGSLFILLGFEFQLGTTGVPFALKIVRESEVLVGKFFLHPPSNYQS